MSNDDRSRIGRLSFTSAGFAVIGIVLGGLSYLRTGRSRKMPIEPKS
ncbi:MAG: hypothetical protein KIT61_13580 [Pyrinomonadaceae bacterium]|nr:hypothetical protein [Pyrinomonadaceae bacterium]